MNIAAIDTPIGRLGLVQEAGAITRLLWDADPLGAPGPLLEEGARQISEYFAGERSTFDLPLRVAGSDFQRAVCEAMRAIPFGDTLTYGDIARKVGAPAQAVGNACGANPIPIIIPCHRVLGATGLGGFSGAGGGLSGIEMKVTLLKHEGAAGLLI